VTSIPSPDLEQLADRLIALIRTKPDVFYPWSKLARRLTTDLESIQRAVETAAAWDYKLKVRKTLGVAFVAAPDSLIPSEILHTLRTRRLGRTLHTFQTVQSTNDLASQYAESGAPEGTIVTAEQQTRGRGRLGRIWFSPPGIGIYLSVILRPTLPPEAAPGLSVLTALALAETLTHYEPGLVQIKWPNDVLINSRKTAGILTELSAERSRTIHVVVGVGINVNQQPGMFPPELRPHATSLRRELRRKVDRPALLRAFLYQLEREYDQYLRHRLRKALPRLRKYSSLINRQVTIQSGQSRTTGSVTDIDLDGRLVLKTAHGVETVVAGEVTVVKE